MSERELRLAANEALFGAVNEQIVALGAALPGDQEEPFSIVCECANPHCTQRMEIDPHLYEQVRAQPARFVVLPAHVIPDIEQVVASHDRYVVVEKDEPVRSLLEDVQPAARTQQPAE
jgi:hypothetical protein